MASEDQKIYKVLLTKGNSSEIWNN